MEMELNMKKWITLIQSGKLSEVVKEFKDTMHLLDKKLNKSIFKMLLHLSHTAAKLNKDDYLIGTNLFELTSLLCSVLIEIPDSDKYFSSIYHITNTLLNMNMYNEAAKVCSFLYLKKFNNSEINLSDKLVTIGHLWRNKINDLFHILQTEGPNSKIYLELNIIIKYELELIEMTYENYTKYLLMKMDTYLEKITAICKSTDTYFNEFYKYVMDYLKNKPILLDENEQNILSIHEMKKCKCKYWTHLWSTCATLIYNLGIISEQYYKESSTLFSLLCSSIIRFEGIQSNSAYINLHNPLCSTLYSLSVVHYTNDMYREAMTICALNGLLSYNDKNSKAFRMWTNIKHKCVLSEQDLKMSMLECLRTDKSKINEIGLCINMSDYDLIQLCIREAKALQEAKVDLSCAFESVINELKLLKADCIQYGQVVQLLGYHLLSFVHDNPILKYLNTAITDIKQDLNRSVPILCLEANLTFYLYINQLYEINKQTQMEMESKEFPLHAPRLSEIQENESCDIVPAYTKINIKEDSHLMLHLQESLKLWNESFENNITEIANGWEPTITLQTLIIVGEYCRLYRYEDCEVNAWILAYKLASELLDHRAVIYVTGRSISLRYINYEWIATAKEYAINLKNCDKKDVVSAIAIFWISLADFYFECGQYSEARSLLNDARALPGISFLGHVSIYLLSLQIIIRNCHLYKDMKHEEYTMYIVDSLYTMIQLEENLSTKKWKCQDEYLFSYDVLFTITIDLSLRMNSVLSFREITAHLMKRLKTAQALTATIRTAELLRSLCFIDLSRTQLEDCEVKLQGLEHILNIETFQLSMNVKLVQTMPTQILTPTRVIDPIRDIPQNNTSPILRKKVFTLPHFILHSNCNCYICQNKSYQYLVFTSTQIRAQMYALQNCFTVALQHFHGAFKIGKQLFIPEKFGMSRNMKRIDVESQFSWHDRVYIIDYMLLLLNFSCFLKSNGPKYYKEALSVALLAINICKLHKLQGHPIYTSVQELIFDSRFQQIFNTSILSKCIVPAACDIDITEYVHDSHLDKRICVTPTTSSVHNKKPISVRRNRTPPLLKLTKVSMDFSKDEEINFSPQQGAAEHMKSKALTKSVRRKILENYSENHDLSVEETELLKHKFISKVKVTKNEANSEETLVKDIVLKVAPLVPRISEHLHKFTDVMQVPLTSTNLETLINMVENLKIHTTIQRRTTKRVDQSKRSYSEECSKKLNDEIALFKEIIKKEIADYSFNIWNETILTSGDNTPTQSILSSLNNPTIHTNKQTAIQENNTKVQDHNMTSENNVDINNITNLHEKETKKTRTKSTSNINANKALNIRKASLRNSKHKPL